MTDKMPSRRQMARNLGKTVKGFVNNPRFASPEEKQRRMEICKECEHFTGSRCRKCGCYLAMKTKIKSAQCPIKKW